MKLSRQLMTAVVMASALILAGCSGTTDDTSMPDHDDHGGMGSSPEASVDANAADLMFAGMMIGHHQQAIEMSDILLAKGGVDTDVAALAQRIKDAQQPEIDQLTAWVTAWGGDPADYEGMDHGGGMMTAEDLEALEATPGPEASKLFLEQMIVHHEGALAMSETHVKNGQNPDAVALSEKIIADQTAEIAEMTELLDALPSS